MTDLSWDGPPSLPACTSCSIATLLRRLEHNHAALQEAPGDCYSSGQTPRGLATGEMHLRRGRVLEVEQGTAGGMVAHDEQIQNQSRSRHIDDEGDA